MQVRDAGNDGKDERGEAADDGSSQERIRPIRWLSQAMAEGLTDAVAFVFNKFLGLPWIDKAWQWLSGKPRLLLSLVTCMGIALTVWLLSPLWTTPVQERPVSASTRPATQSAAVPSPDAGNTQEQEVLAVITAYNQASIAANLLNNPDLMQPYLDTKAVIWPNIQKEYTTRMAQGMTKELTLVRWGVLKIEAPTKGTVQVMTQEEWDSVANVAGTIVNSQRGIIVRNTYTLVQPDDTSTWLIQAIRSEVAVQ